MIHRVVQRWDEAWDRLPLWEQWPRYCSLLLSCVLLLGLILLKLGPASQAIISQRSPVRAQLSSFKMAIELYRIDHAGMPPTQSAGLNALLHPPQRKSDAARWKGPYLLDVTTIPHDPWGRPYVYQAPGAGGEPYEVLSYGADGKPGGMGDVEDVSTSLR